MTFLSLFQVIKSSKPSKIYIFPLNQSKIDKKASKNPKTPKPQNPLGRLNLKKICNIYNESNLYTLEVAGAWLLATRSGLLSRAEELSFIWSSCSVTRLIGKEEGTRYQ